MISLYQVILVDISASCSSSSRTTTSVGPAHRAASVLLWDVSFVSEPTAAAACAAPRGSVGRLIARSHALRHMMLPVRTAVCAQAADRDYEAPWSPTSAPAAGTQAYLLLLASTDIFFFILLIM